MAELVSTTRAGRRQTFERMRDLLRDAIDDPDVRGGMSVDLARRIEEVLVDADATELSDLDQPPDRPL
jgi:hypothetical protein